MLKSYCADFLIVLISYIRSRSYGCLCYNLSKIACVSFTVTLNLTKESKGMQL